MKNISVLIEGTGKKTFRFKKPIVTYGTRLAAKEVTVFWNFKNITSAIGNNTFGIKGSAVVLDQWSLPVSTRRAKPTRLAWI